MFFVDRVQEMSVLQTAYEKPESSLFVLYGRRRVGKTTLCQNSAKRSRLFIIWQRRKAFRQTETPSG